jgi:NAD(P)-dependent dehydrogenase (short-subunit alcohol dehydrogenase family)
MNGSVLVVGGTAGIGLEVARHYLGEGREVALTGRDPERAARVASDLGAGATGIGFDLADPGSIAPALQDLGPISRLVLSGIARDSNSVRDYDFESAVQLTVMKLVGYIEVIHAVSGRLSSDASILIFGGRAKDRPYPGSTTVTTINGGVERMINTLVVELAPIRVNALHPGIVGDSPFWENKDLSGVLARTPTGRLTTMADVVDATVFLLENKAVNGVNLYIDGGWMLM